VSTDPSEYSDGDLLEAYESVDKDRYPERFQELVEELNRRGFEASAEHKIALDASELFRDLAAVRRLKLRCALVVLAIGGISILVRLVLTLLK